MKLKREYDKNGFVHLPGFFTPKEVATLRKAFDKAAKKGALHIGIDDFEAVNDVVFMDPVFAKIAKHPRLVKAVQEIFAQKDIELQHAKFFNKPLKDTGSGTVHWHQDYQFFPHTNLDLIAVAIHLDDETKDSGALMVVPGSHKKGMLSHVKKGKFAYQITVPFKKPSVKELLCRAGDVSMHHALTVHASKSKKNHALQRRILYFEYRSCDNVQIAGALYKATGYPITNFKGPRMARFMDGTSVELRGEKGRLYDLYGKLAPDHQKTGSITGKDKMM